MASGVTVAIDALTAVIKEGIDNSKIINTLDKEISKALGLLVDLILLPFLPLLVGAIVTLYMAVIAFGQWWNNVTSVLKKEGLLGLIKLSLQWLWDGITNVVKGLFEYLWGDDAGKSLNLKISATIAGIFDLLVGWILDFLFGEGSGKRAAKILEVSLNVLQAFADWLVSSVLDWIFGTHNAEAKLLNLQIVSAELVGLWWDLIKVVFGEDAKKILSIDVAFVLADAGNWVNGAIKWIMQGGGGGIGNQVQFGVDLASFLSGVPKAASGGNVEQTGLAVIHKGETITPAGGNSGNTTFNFYGLSNEELPEKIRSVLRQDGTRFNV